VDGVVVDGVVVDGVVVDGVVEGAADAVTGTPTSSATSAAHRAKASGAGTAERPGARRFPREAEARIMAVS
jgi:hypothetical protein